jgi:hypothetical protein
MAQRPYIELSYFESAKSTDNKLRWDAPVEDAVFNFYIPKWRVPTPWPRKIGVSLCPVRGDSQNFGNLSRTDGAADPSLVLEPIVATVVRLTFNESDMLRIVVFWDLATRGEF